MSGLENRPRILVIAQIPEALLNALSRDSDLISHVLEGRDSASLRDLPDCEAVLTRAIFGIPEQVLNALPNLKLIVSLGAGIEKFDLADLGRRGIKLLHTPDELTEDVADYAVGLVYAVQRKISAADRFVRSGGWRRGRFGYSRRVSCRHAGIVGTGRIGIRIAEKLSVLGLTVSCYSRSVKPDLSYQRFQSVVDLAEAVDILILACAGTEETRHLVNGAVLDALGPEGLLINIARGSVVDEDALIAALKNGVIGAAALDVFEREPDIDSRFLELNNLVLSPHAASLTEEAREAMNARLIQGVREHFNRKNGAT
jgi:lactate dehydrogenase-like 2-hydroxyacid dehydrogenase